MRKEPLKLKLFDLLSKMDVYERNRFLKYVRSPFFNEVKELVELLKFYLPFFKKNKPILLSKEEVWAKLSFTEIYNDVKFRRLNSDLSKLAEQFLAYLAYESYPTRNANNLLKIANEREIDKLYHTAYKSAKNTQEKWVYRNADFHYEQYRLETEFHSMLERGNRTAQNLLPAVEQLDKFYLSEKLRFLCSLLTYKNVVNAEDEMLLVNEILQHLQIQKYDDEPAIAVYHQALLSLMHPEAVEHYHQLKVLLAKFSAYFPAEEARNLYIVAQNYCIKKVNAGNSYFLNELLDLYKALINTQLIFKGNIQEDNVLSPWTYKNIITVSLRVGELDWALKFIEDFKDYIPEMYRDNAYTYNLAKYHFYLKDYDEVISLLINVDYQGVFYILDAKSLLLKTYYETDENAALTSLMDSFKVLLNRKKMVAPNYRKMYKNLIRYIKKIRNIRDGGKKNIEEVEKQLTAESQVADITWLKEKIEELK